MAGGALAAADAVEQVGPGVVVLAAEHAHELAQGAGVVAAQQLRQGSEHEAARLGLALGEHAQAGQAPQQPEQGLAIGAARWSATASSAATCSILVTQLPQASWRKRPERSALGSIEAGRALPVYTGISAAVDGRAGLATAGNAVKLR